MRAVTSSCDLKQKWLLRTSMKVWRSNVPLSRPCCAKGKDKEGQFRVGWLRRRRGKSKGTTAGQVRAGQGRKVPSAAAEQSEQNNKDEEQQVSVSAVSVTIDLNAELSMRRARAS